MHERHRQQQFHSPFEAPELELDPEKKLWIPGKKKFFIPTAPKFTVPAFEPVTLSLKDFYFPSLRQIDFYSRLAECVPGRDEFIVPRATEESEARRAQQLRERTWNDITRSMRPAFRNRRFVVGY